MVSALALLLALIPAFLAARWVYRYGVDVPLRDDWDAAPLVIKAWTGQLAWADLFQQQQEARYVLPKLIFIAASAGGHWDMRRLMIASLAVCAMTALGLFWLAVRSGIGGLTRALAFGLMSLLLFSAAQYELWTWASGLPCFLPGFFLVAALCLLETGLSTAAKFALCALLAGAASFTLPHGLLLWGLTFPCLFCRREILNWKRWLIAWTSAIALCAAIYFHGYLHPQKMPEFAPALPLLTYAEYFFSFLGGELAYATSDYRIAVAAALGVLLFAAYLGALVYLGNKRRDGLLTRRAIPWIVLGGYAIGSGVLATLGRVGYGIGTAISSRYVAFSLYLSVAVIALAVIIGKQPGMRYLRAGGFIFCALFLAFHASASTRSVRLMAAQAAQARQAKGALLFCRAFDTSALMKRTLYYNPTWTVVQATALNDLQLLRPPLLQTNELERLPHRAASDDLVGEWETSAASPNESWQAAGCAAFKDEGRHRAADAIVFCSEDSSRVATAFALADEMIPQYGKHWRKSAWKATIAREAVPPGATITAWALDVETPMLHPLPRKGANLP